jgi:hypothetical protein
LLCKRGGADRHRQRISRNRKAHGTRTIAPHHVRRAVRTVRRSIAS